MVLNFTLKLLDLKSHFTPTMGFPNPALNNAALNYLKENLKKTLQA